MADLKGRFYGIISLPGSSFSHTHFPTVENHQRYLLRRAGVFFFFAGIMWFYVKPDNAQSVLRLVSQVHQYVKRIWAKTSHLGCKLQMTCFLIPEIRAWVCSNKCFNLLSLHTYRVGGRSMLCLLCAKNSFVTYPYSISRTVEFLFLCKYCKTTLKLHCCWESHFN